MPHSDSINIRQDSVSVQYGSGELKFSRAEFENIKADHPELSNNLSEGPDALYKCYVNGLDFGSEAGQDTYYILYAYLLKQKHTGEKYDNARVKLFEAFSIINSINEILEDGGPAFSHQRVRTSGYVEYALESLNNEDDFLYNISRQKEIYVMGLKQLVNDQLGANLNIHLDAKPKLKAEMNQLIDRLGNILTDNYYLRTVQEYHYSNFIYY